MAADPLELVTALWQGPHDAEIGRSVLRTGQDTFEITRAEAERSENWLFPIPSPKAQAAAAKAEKADTKDAA